MKKFLLFGLVIFSISFLSACGTPLQEYEPKNEMEKEIKNLLIEFAQARNDYNANKMASLFTDTGRLILDGRPIPITEYASVWKKSDLKTAGQYKWINPKILMKDTIAEAGLSGKQGFFSLPFNFKLIHENNRWKISELSVSTG